MIMDISPLEKSIARLDEGLTRYQQHRKDAQLRDGLIQRFEFTYELSHKMLKRYLKLTSATPQLFDDMPFQDLVRLGNAQGLLHDNWPIWRKYREMRTKTSHTYDEEVALEVVTSIPDFLKEAIYLHEQLKKHVR